MANRYAVTAGGFWNVTSSWATTSGGSSGASVPLASDDVFLDNNSGSVTVSSNVVCRSLNCTGYTGTLSQQSANQITIGDGTSGASNVALLFVSGMGYSNNTLTTSVINFNGTSGTTQTITTGGKTLPTLNFNNTSTYQLQDSLTTGNQSGISMVKGTLLTNNQTMAIGYFNANSGTAVCAANFGSSTIGLNYPTTGSPLWINNANFTLTAGTSTINMASTAASFIGGGRTFYNVNFTTTGVLNISGNNTFNNVSITNATTANIAGGTYASLNISPTVANPVVNFAVNPTISGTLTLAGGNASTQRLLVASSIGGGLPFAAQCTLTAATLTASNVDFRDIIGAGAASWSLSAITGGSGDCGGNSGITFTTPVPQTWSGTSGGNWSANAWSGRVPLPQDPVKFASNFGTVTITNDVSRLGASVDWSGCNNSGVVSWAGTGIVYGSVIWTKKLQKTTAVLSCEWRSANPAYIDYSANDQQITFGISMTTLNRCFINSTIKGINLGGKL